MPLTAYFVNGALLGRANRESSSTNMIILVDTKSTEAQNVSLLFYTFRHEKCCLFYCNNSLLLPTLKTSLLDVSCMNLTHNFTTHY